MPITREDHESFKRAARALKCKHMNLRPQPIEEPDLVSEAWVCVDCGNFQIRLRYPPVRAKVA